MRCRRLISSHWGVCESFEVVLNWFKKKRRRRRARYSTRDWIDVVKVFKPRICVCVGETERAPKSGRRNEKVPFDTHIHIHTHTVQSLNWICSNRASSSSSFSSLVSSIFYYSSKSPLILLFVVEFVIAQILFPFSATESLTNKKEEEEKKERKSKAKKKFVMRLAVLRATKGLEPLWIT